MAIFHMTAKVCKTSASAKVDYIQRQNKYSYSTKAEDLVFSYEKNIPSWAKNARDFFDEMDKQELSKNEKEHTDNSSEDRKVKCREIEFALPTELSKEEQIELTKKFCQKIMGDTHAYTFAIHKNIGALSGVENPHVHLVYSDRLIVPNREVPRELFCRQRTGYKKDPVMTGAKRHEWYRDVRKTWADMVNERLREKDVPLISEKSYKEQGIERKPQDHLGHDTVHSLARGAENERYERYKAVLRDNIEQSTRKEFEPQIKALKPSIKQRLQAGVHLAFYNYVDERYKEQDKSLLKGETDDLVKFKRKMVQTIEERYKDALESRIMNSRGIVERKSYYSKAKRTEEAHRTLDKLYEKIKYFSAQPEVKRVYTDEKNLVFNKTFAGGIRLPMGKVTSRGVFIDSNNQRYELAHLAKIQGNQLTLLGSTYSIKSTEQLEFLKKSFEESFEVVKIERLREENKARSEILERMKLTEEQPTTQAITLQKEKTKVKETKKEMDQVKSVAQVKTPKVKLSISKPKTNGRGGFSR